MGGIASAHCLKALKNRFWLCIISWWLASVRGNKQFIKLYCTDGNWKDSDVNWIFCAVILLLRAAGFISQIAVVCLNKPWEFLLVAIALEVPKASKGIVVYNKVSVTCLRDKYVK